MNWLVLTIGGTSKVAVDAIVADPRPDRVYFLCSGAIDTVRKGSAELVQGRGHVCKSNPLEKKCDLPSIPVQASLTPEQWQLSCFDLQADNLGDCYLKSMSAFKRIRETDPAAQIWADYTGGTKSMTAGLALAALDDGRIKLVLEAGTRNDLLKTGNDNYQVSAATDAVVQYRAVHRVRELLTDYQYGAAARMLEQLARGSSEMASRNRRLHAVCLAFDAWDRFDHRRALEFLDSADTKNVYGRYRAALSAVVKAIERVEEDGITPLPAWKTKAGYLLAADILANGRRRASRYQYDDAIGRHYRACELIAQTALWIQFKVDAGNVSPAQVPDTILWRDTLGAEPALGFLHSWELLAAKSGGSSTGNLWNAWSSKVRSAMKHRNYSLLAHGTQPVTQADYDNDVQEGMGGFASAALKCLATEKQFKPNLLAPEFPTDFPDLS